MIFQSPGSSPLLLCGQFQSIILPTASCSKSQFQQHKSIQNEIQILQNKLQGKTRSLRYLWDKYSWASDVFELQLPTTPASIYKLKEYWDIILSIIIRRKAKQLISEFCPMLQPFLPQKKRKCTKEMHSESLLLLNQQHGC